MKKIIILIVLLLFAINIFSSTRLDQLKLELKTSDGLEKVLILDKLQRSYWKIYPQASLEFGVQALKIAARLNNNVQQAQQLQNIAESYKYLDDYEKAIEFMLLSLKKAIKANNLELQIAAYYYLATYNNHIAKNVLAFEYAVLALDLSKEHKNHPGLAKCYFIIAEIYYALGDLEGAYQNYELSLVQHKKFSNKSSFAFTNEKLGEIDLHNKNYQFAEQHFKIAADNYTEIDNLESLVRTYEVLGKIYKKTGNKEKAFEYIQKFADTNEKLNREINENKLLYNYEYYNITGNEERALEYFKLYTAQQDSLKYAINKEQVETIISNIETKHEQEKVKTTEKIDEVTNKAVEEIKEKEKTIEQLKTEKKYQEVTIKQDNEKKRKQIEELQRDRVEKDKKLAEQKKQKKLYLYYIIISVVIVILLLSLTIVYISKYRMKQKHTVELEKIAKTDPLTQLPNRRAVMEKINYEIVRFRRSNDPFTIVISDIDNFKKVNDSYGHDAGDKVLVSLSKLMLKTIRKQDICARWGGEEFLFLLPGTDSEGGEIITEKIRDKIENKVIKFKDISLPITMTFGFCTFTKDLTIDECITNADKALYEGKKKGKNCIIQYHKLQNKDQ